MERFAGRVAVVTGASAGIGASIARELAAAGMVVVCVARRKERLEELAASVAAAGAAGRVQALQADVSSLVEVRRVFQWVEDHLGGVAVMVNNAAVSVGGHIYGTDTLLYPRLRHDVSGQKRHLDLASMEAVVSTNVTAYMACCKEAVSSMRKHGITDGHIINVNSVTGHMIVKDTQAPISAYNCTKHAVTALSRALHYDLQHIPGFQIRVTNLSPGVVYTALTERFLPDPSLVLTTEDVAKAAIFALSCPPTVEITELTINPLGIKL